MGELRKRGNVWWIRYYRNGRRHEESSRSTRKGDAERLLRLREGDVAKGLPISAKVGQLRFDEAAADVVADYAINGRKTTAHVERRIEKHLQPFFGGRRLASITTADVRAYVASRQAPRTLEDGSEKRGAANATINRELSVLKRTFRLAQQSGKVLHSPHVPMLREDNAREGFFEPDEFAAVHDNLPAYLQGVATFGYLTGWRKGEILGLTWGNVDRAAKVIRLEPGTTKNSEGRTLPYDALPELEQVIAAQWAEHQRLASEGTLSPWVFQRGGELIGSFVKAWKTACSAAGCPGKLFHDFRRTAVRNLVRAGVSEHTAMQITGHKTRSVFDRYDIVNEADIRAGLGMLEASTVPAAGTKKGQSGRVRQMPSS